MRNTGPQSSNAAQEAAAQARRAALEAAAARRRAEAAQAAQAAQMAQATQAKKAAPAPVGDANTASAMATLEKGAMAKGAMPLPPPPQAGGELERALLGAMGLMGPGASVEAAMGFLSDLRGRLEGQPPVAAGAVTSTMMDPSGFYAASGALKGQPEMARAEGDLRAVQAMTTADHLAKQLEDEPDLSKYPAETVAQLASFREVDHPGLQSALDNALKETFENDGLDPGDLSKEMAYLAHKSSDPDVKEALEDRVKAWADKALERGLDGKEKESGVEDGLGEFQEDMIKLAEQTGLGDIVQNAAERALKDGEKLIEDTAKRGRSLWDKFTGAVSGFIDGAFGAIGDGIKKAIGAVGDVASFAVDKVGDVAEAGLDLAASGLDAVGAEGAADFTRKAGDAVDGAYDWVGKQADGFVDGVGDALGDTVTGIGSTLAHPIETVKGVAHLVANPGQIVEVGKALWATASEGGTAHAIGYIAGNLAPALLTGGSTSAGSLTARIGAIAGESRVLTTLVTGAKASRVGAAISRGGQAASSLASAIGSTRLAQGVGRAAELAGKARAGTATFVRESRFGRLAVQAGEQLRLPQILEKFRGVKLKLNDKVDNFLGAQVRKLDDTALGRGIERKLSAHAPSSVSTEARLAQLAAEGVPGQGPIPLGRDAEGVIKQRGVDGDAVYDEVGADGARLNNPSDRELGEIPRERGLHGESGEIQRLKQGDRLEGTFSTGRGSQPDIVSDFDGPVFQERIGERARVIGADPKLTPQQKLDQINELVNRNLKANFSTDDIAKLDAYHEGFNASGRHVSTENYLQDGLADCRGYCTIHQMALQEAGFKSGIAVSKTVLEDVGGAVPPGLVREADGLSHYYNVVELDGKQVIADAFNPAASGHELAEALSRGFVDRQGNRLVHYQPGSYGATVLNDGLGRSFGASTLVAPGAAAVAASREEGPGA